MKDEIVVVAFGDSITKGDNVKPEERFVSIAERIFSHHCAKPVRVINAGVNSDITTLALNRIDSDVLSHNPDVVTVMFGVNDAGFFRPDAPPADTPRVSAEDYEKNLETIAERITAAGAIAVMGTPLPMSRYYGLADLPQYKEHGLNYLVDRYAQIMRDVAARRKLPLIDLHKAFSENPSTEEFLPDGIHPNAQGHAFIAKLYVKVLLPVLKGL